MSKPKEESTSTVKLDFVRAIEREVQQEWEDKKIFELDAPEDGQQPKYMATFPFPYMNGRLHLGHTFTLTKAEFAVGYQRLKGKRALFPFGFHCTGMPIKACADKLAKEIEMYGNPPNFPPPPAEEEEEPAVVEKSVSNAATPPATKKDGAAKKDAAPKKDEKKKADPLAFTSKKTKTQQKSGGASYQWQILKEMDVPESEIPLFADPKHWLKYFPPYCQSDLKTMGLGVDWRRSFITTDINPYFDSFVRWTFETLKDLGKIKFGKRYTIWSPLDGQACMDHDRASGEGVLPQEYTLIKLEVMRPLPEKLASLEAYNVYLVPGTLRPETMYGQTNCWILPEGKYVAARVNEKDVFICTERAAKNMAFQELSRTPGKYEVLLEVTGQDLIGTPLRAPLSVYDKVYVLPMTTINPDKGTGIVTSVPSDAPDDYAALADVKKKKEYFQNTFGVDPKWAEFEPVPIINIPEYGDLAAIKVCQDLGVKSQNDRKALDTAKDLVYTKGFYDGTMLIGPHKGMKVKDAKNVIRDEMLNAGQAAKYCEPAERVVSRSGDDCVVALADQWYLTYGSDDEWKKQTAELLNSMEMYEEETKKQFKLALDWMEKWACSRSFGLGSRIPWDDQYLIESLSDSTIYMAYYTFAHLLQGGVVDGSVVGPSGIKPEQLTRAVWDWLLLPNREFPSDTTIPRQVLDKMKKEFKYWYPVDIRVSGKDLIQNHLTFFLYCHTAVFPPEHRPVSVRTNGHVLLNGKKMSKSTGNFLTLYAAVDKFSADGMRIGLASAGDSLEDANFAEPTAVSAMLRLHSQYLWVEEVLGSISTLRTGEPNTFADKAFQSAVFKYIQETETYYEKTQFREAVRTGFFELQSARDQYRFASEETGMHKDLLLWFIEVQAIIMTPICPHFSEKIWKMLKKEGSVLHASWPKVGDIDKEVVLQEAVLSTSIGEWRSKIQVYRKTKTKNDPNAVITEANLVVSNSIPAWQKDVIAYAKDNFDESTGTFDDKKVLERVKEQEAFKPLMQKAMSFINETKAAVATKGKDAFNLGLTFDEKTLYESNLAFISRALEVAKLSVIVDDEAAPKTNAFPGKPAISVLKHDIVEKPKKEKQQK